jgi:hypothetical protein
MNSFDNDVKPWYDTIHIFAVACFSHYDYMLIAKCHGGVYHIAWNQSRNVSIQRLSCQVKIEDEQ